MNLLGDSQLQALIMLLVSKAQGKIELPLEESEKTWMMLQQKNAFLSVSISKKTNTITLEIKEGEKNVEPKNV